MISGAEYTREATNTGGCDSTHYLTAIISEPDSVVSYLVVCDTFSWNSQFIDTSGVYHQSFNNIGGCDSIHTLIVSILPSIITNSTISSCENYIWNGQLIDSSWNIYSNFYK